MMGLTSNGVIKSLLSKMASLVWGVEDLIVENGEVEGKTQSDGVSWGKVGLRNLSGSLVSLERLVGGGLALVANGKLGEVAVVVTLPIDTKFSKCTTSAVFQRKALHLVVEDLGLAALSRWDQVLVKHVEDVLADATKLVLDLLAVLLDERDLTLVAL